MPSDEKPEIAEKDDKEEDTEESTEEDKEEKSEITSNEGVTDAGLTPTTTTDGGESSSESTPVKLESSNNTDVSDG